MEPGAAFYFLGRNLGIVDGSRRDVVANDELATLALVFVKRNPSLIGPEDRFTADFGQKLLIKRLLVSSWAGNIVSIECMFSDVGD